MAATNKGLFVWYEHLTRDVQAAIAFYGDVAVSQSVSAALFVGLCVYVWVAANRPARS